MTLRRVNDDLMVGVRVKVEFIWKHPPLDPTKADVRDKFESNASRYVERFAEQIADRLLEKIRRDTDAISRRRAGEVSSNVGTHRSDNTESEERIHPDDLQRSQVRVSGEREPEGLSGGRRRRIL